MTKMTALFLTLGLLSTGVGCEDLMKPPEQPAQEKKSTCALSLDTLEGGYAYQLPGTEDVDDRIRVKFMTDGGTQKLIATEGTVDKKVYTRTEMRKYDAVYLEDRDIEDINRFKAENKDPNARLQGKMYVRVNEPRCQVRVSETFITYVNGELKEAPMFRESWYKPSAHTYSWEKCSDPMSLRFSEEPFDPAKVGAPGKRDKPLLRAIPANKPAYFSTFVADDEIGDNCSVSFDVFDEDIQVASKLTDVAEGKDGKVLSFDRTFKPYDTGRFVEVHAFQTCAGKRELIKVACGVVKPE